MSKIKHFIKEVQDKGKLSRVMKSTVGIELHVEDFEPVRDFYTNIGFEIIFDSPGNYLTIRKNKVILNFWGDGGRFEDQPYFKQFSKSTKKGFAVEIIVPVNNIEDYYNQIKGEVDIVSNLKVKRWGASDFRIVDPNGFYIRFTNPHDWVYEFEGYSTDEDN